MKVAVIDEWLPWPLETGKKIRTFNLISRLAKSNDIFYVAYADVSVENGKIRALEDEGIRVFPVADSRIRKWGARFYLEVMLNLLSDDPFSTRYHIKEGFGRVLQEVLRREKPDLVHCEWTNLAPFLEYSKDFPCVIAAHNVESDIWKRLGEHGTNPLKRVLGLSQARKIERLERTWYPRADKCIAVTEKDLGVIESYGAKVDLVENGVDIRYYETAKESGDENALIFTASFDTFSNQDGARFFVQEIYPLIKKGNPMVSLWLVGKDPPRYMRTMAENDPSIHVTGKVEDVRSYIARAGVCVVPLRIGGGSRLKILEALAMGKAVVSTAVGAEGLRVTEGRDILIRDDPSSFAQAVEQCIRVPELRASLGGNGFGLVGDTYDWDRLAERQGEIWASVVKAGDNLGGIRLIHEGK